MLLIAAAVVTPLAPTFRLPGERNPATIELSHCFAPSSQDFSHPGWLVLTTLGSSLPKKTRGIRHLRKEEQGGRRHGHSGSAAAGKCAMSVYGRGRPALLGRRSSDASDRASDHRNHGLPQPPGGRMCQNRRAHETG